jgi:hypothetical protein
METDDDSTAAALAVGGGEALRLAVLFGARASILSPLDLAAVDSAVQPTMVCMSNKATPEGETRFTCLVTNLLRRVVARSCRGMMVTTRIVSDCLFVVYTCRRRCCVARKRRAEGGGWVRGVDG